MHIVLCMPDIVCRTELLADRKFQVRDSNGAVVGCKLCCPTCGINSFVLTSSLGGMNVDGERDIRFGWTHESTFVVVHVPPPPPSSPSANLTARAYVLHSHVLVLPLS